MRGAHVRTLPRNRRRAIRHTVEGLDESTSQKVVDLLQQRLVALIDLQLTLKHIHWNVVGPNFIAVHEMLDPQTDMVRGATDDMAERIATLGGTPNGLPGNLTSTRTWDDYGLGTASVQDHLRALDAVYDGVISDHRDARDAIEDLDAISEDVLVEQLRGLELAQWFVRAHVESAT